MRYYYKYYKYKKKYLLAKKQLNLIGGDLDFKVIFNDEEIPKDNIGEDYYDEDTTYQQLRYEITGYLNKVKDIKIDHTNVFFLKQDKKNYKKTRKLSENEYDNEIDDNFNIIVVIETSTVDPIAEGVRQGKLKMKSGENEDQVITFPDGSSYKGKMLNGMPHGKDGLLTIPNGYSYQGEFKDGKPNGPGKEIKPDGSSYEGDFKDGKYNGEGIKTWADEYKYQGRFEDGKPNGPGKETLPNGVFYEGEFKDGRYNGQGIVTHPDGYNYKGEFKDGKYNGQGIVTYPEGGSYQGEFKDGKYNGQGIVTHPDGYIYKGEFKDGRYNGQGIITYPEGGGYQGEFKDGRYNGRGKQTLPSGDFYEGEFKDGRFNGRGKQTLPSGVFYEGEFKDGRYNGQGIETDPDPDGHVYHGEFKDGTYNGRGKATYSNGSSYEGEFKDGRYNGQGKQTLPSGAFYEGEFKNGEYNGQGTQTFPNKDVYQGGWSNGFLMCGKKITNDILGQIIEEGKFKMVSSWETKLINGKKTTYGEIEYIEPELPIYRSENKPRNSHIIDMLTKNGFENNLAAVSILHILEEEYEKIKEVKFPTTELPFDMDAFNYGPCEEVRQHNIEGEQIGWHFDMALTNFINNLKENSVGMTGITDFEKDLIKTLYPSNNKNPDSLLASYENLKSTFPVASGENFSPNRPVPIIWSKFKLRNLLKPAF